MLDRGTRLLLIEDHPGDARQIRELLREAGLAVELDLAETLRAALERLGKDPPDAVLLDLTLPDSRGLETFLAVQRAAPVLPIVVLSGLDDQELAARAVGEGAQDYLVKGQVDGSLLGRSLRYAIERKRADHRVREANARFRILYEESPLGTVLLDPEGRLVQANPAFCRMLGEPEERLRGRSFGELAHPEDTESARECFGKLSRGEARCERCPWRFLRSDGGLLWTEVTASAVHDAAGRFLWALALVEDLTERKLAEVEIERAREAQQRSALLKSAFLANLSHEIRTPLNVILGGTNVIVERRRGEDADVLRAMQRAASRLLATVEGILDLSRMETGDFEVRPVVLRLAPLLERLAREFEPLACEKGLALVCEVAEPEAAVRFDRYCLERTLANLLENAVKFTSEGRVELRLVRDQGGELYVEIRDTGVGIDPRFLPRLFERFSQEDPGYSRRFEGCGLGLALAREYVERNGGRISVESRKGVGSVFRIHLPIP
jgi:PAS domain S-box-containing protein